MVVEYESLLFDYGAIYVKFGVLLLGHLISIFKTPVWGGDIIIGATKNLWGGAEVLWHIDYFW